MILYHGSNVEIDAIDFNKSKVGKDFGIGFYLSAEEEQAQEMADKKTLLLGGKPTITRFEFDEEAAKADNLAYLRYEKYGTDWGKFVKMNRDNKSRVQLHSYDIIYGPIADDNIGLHMQYFEKISLCEHPTLCCMSQSCTPYPVPVSSSGHAHPSTLELFLLPAPQS